MKPLLSISAGILLVSSCMAQSGISAIGTRTATGTPVGNFRIVDADGSTMAQGRFRDGKMNGTWLFFDSRHVKIAEVTYVSGVASGPYKTYFASRFDPSAAGKLESEGRVQGGKIAGEHIAYAPDGSIFSKATIGAGGVRDVKVGVSEAAAKTAEADIRFIQTLEEIVHSATK